MHDAPHAASRFILQERDAMPNPITFQRACEVVNANPDQLRAIISDGGKFRIKGTVYDGGKLKIGRAEYKVTVAKNRKGGREVDVSANNCWAKFRNFFSSRRIDKLKQLLNGTQGLLSGKAMRRLETPESLRGKATNCLRNQAAYGFHEVRLRSDSTNPNSRMQRMITINDLNDEIGVDFYNMRKNLAPIPAPRRISPLADAWRTKLNGQITSSPERFDMFKRIQILEQIANGENPKGATEGMKAKVKASGASGLDVKIGDLLRKNSDELNRDIRNAGGIKSDAGQQILDQAVENAKRIAKMDIDERMRHLARPGNAYLRDASAIHYFRNTSKLGLEFFGQQRIPVAFWLQDPDGKTLNSRRMLQNEARNEHYAEGFNKAITFSEMCHVMRMKAKGEGDHIHFVTSANP
jgi:hypothetical protein